MFTKASKHLIVFLAGLFLAISSIAHADELIVSAAASLTNAFQDIKPLFEKAHPGTTVTLNFGASGALLKQIQAGAPADVFASADQETMDKAKEQIAAATRTDFAANSLVLIVPAQSTLGIAKLEDLKKPAVEHIAIGNPDSVPAGRYAKSSLTSAGLYDTLTPKCVLAENVRQALDYVVRGEAQAGFVFGTDVTGKTDKIKVILEATGHAPITYPVAIVAASQHQDAAKAFIAFLKSTEGQAALAKYGFKKP